jgi:hypothetical protein
MRERERERESGESFSERASKDEAERFEHYELLIDEDERPVELGRGAMGVTYKAFDVDLGCPVTLKVISENILVTRRSDFVSCGKRVRPRAVRHPNVASL